MLDAFAEWYYYHYIEVFTWLFGTTPDTALGTAIRVLTMFAYPITWYLTQNRRCQRGWAAAKKYVTPAVRRAAHRGEE